MDMRGMCGVTSCGKETDCTSGPGGQGRERWLEGRVAKAEAVVTME